MNWLFPYQTPPWLSMVFPKFSWRKKPAKDVIYLTFDDGPIPEATPKILKYLSDYQATATFFCVGENITRYPEIFQQVLEAGHSVGNHSYHHLDGWRTPTDIFLEDVSKCQLLLNDFMEPGMKPLMRPPYGRLKRSQWRALLTDYDIVMWDVLSGDFSPSIDAKTCLKKTIKFSKKGSIVLFHDSIKTIKKLESVLPSYLDYFSQLGYSFKSL